MYFPNKNGRFISRRPVIHKIVSSMYLTPNRDSNQIKMNGVKLGIEPFIRKSQSNLFPTTTSGEKNKFNQKLVQY